MLRVDEQSPGGASRRHPRFEDSSHLLQVTGGVLELVAERSEFFCVPFTKVLVGHLHVCAHRLKALGLHKGGSLKGGDRIGGFLRPAPRQTNHDLLELGTTDSISEIRLELGSRMPKLGHQTRKEIRLDLRNHVIETWVLHTKTTQTDSFNGP